jgi:hypothetical protein
MAMRILLKLLVATACAWALPVHGQAHANASPPAQGTPAATHAPVSAMGRAMAALLDQAARTQAKAPRARNAAVPPDVVAIDTQPATTAQDTRIADDATPGQVAVH